MTPEMRRRLIEEVHLGGRPIAHVAADALVSRQTLSLWYSRWLIGGDEALYDLSSRPDRSPNRISEDVERMIVEIRLAEKWGAQRIAAFLSDCGEDGIKVSHSTVHRVLESYGISKVRDLDPRTGADKREIQRYEYDDPGGMIHIDVKKVGVIPKGGGWRVHGRDTEAGREARRVAARGGKKRLGYAYIHSAVDDHSRLAYTEVHYNERGDTCAQVLTDNGPAYRGKVFNRALEETSTKHRYTKPFTPRTNGKVERYNGIMKQEWLLVRAYDSEDDRTAHLPDFLSYYNYERPHSALSWKSPCSRVPLPDFRWEYETAGLTVVALQPDFHPDQPSLWDR